MFIPFLRILLLFILIITNSIANAGSLNISGSTDSANTNSSYLDLSFNPGEDIQLYMGFGASNIKDISGEIKTNIYNFGLSGIASKHFDYELGYSFWGNKNEISSETLFFGLSLYTQNWTFTLRPEKLQIALYTKTKRHQVNVSGSGIYGSMQYFGIHNIELLYSHSRYNYNRKLAPLNSRLADLFFSNTTLQLSGTFLDSKDYVEIAFIPSSIRWLPERMALSYSRTINAIDKTQSHTFALNLSVNLSKKLAIDLKAGQITPESNQKLNFAAVGLSIVF